MIVTDAVKGSDLINLISETVVVSLKDVVLHNHDGHWSFPLHTQKKISKKHYDILLSTNIVSKQARYICKSCFIGANVETDESESEICTNSTDNNKSSTEQQDNAADDDDHNGTLYTYLGIYLFIHAGYLKQHML